MVGAFIMQKITEGGDSNGRQKAKTDSNKGTGRQSR